MNVKDISNLALLAAAYLPPALPAVYLSHSCPAAPAHGAAAAAAAALLCRLALQRGVSAAAAPTGTSSPECSPSGSSASTSGPPW